MENMYPERTPREILKSKTCEFFKENNFKLCCTMHPDPGSLANVRTLGAKSPTNPGGFWWCFLRATPPLRLP